MNQFSNNKNKEYDLEERTAKFMQKIGSGYTGYFNAKYNRSGSLF
ncbi:MAG: hypothetical protein U9R14_01345 [Patescibacteria group bacterium]|nr:hypothetical protein [Patescibacteria group bacterium]